jgi:hypothetical protein
MANSWIDHIRKYASDNKMTYSCALSDPRCKEEYNKSKNKKLSSEVLKKIGKIKVPKSNVKV